MKIWAEVRENGTDVIFTDCVDVCYLIVTQSLYNACSRYLTRPVSPWMIRLPMRPGIARILTTTSVQHLTRSFK